MDTMFGFEYAKHDPEDWWRTVPTNFNTRLHFRNVPVSADVDSDANPLNVLRDVAMPDDFVAFKLDIDTNAVEIPIALQLASDPELLGLVDEFFFELHFYCPVMSRAGWGSTMSVPPGYEGRLELTRVGALDYFTKLRERGIRAHFWV
jgi:hypothetical protein